MISVNFACYCLHWSIFRSKVSNFDQISKNEIQIDTWSFKANKYDMVQIKRMLLDFHASYYKHSVWISICMWSSQRFVRPKLRYWLLVNYKLLVLRIMAVAIQHAIIHEIHTYAVFLTLHIQSHHFLHRGVFLSLALSFLAEVIKWLVFIAATRLCYYDKQ